MFEGDRMEKNIYGWEAPKFKQLQKKDSLLSLSFNESKFKYDSKESVSDLMACLIDRLTAKVVKPSSKEEEFDSQLIVEGNSYKDTTFSVVLNEEGEYKIELLLQYSRRHYYYNQNPNDPLVGSEIYRENFSFKSLAYFSVEPEQKLSPYTIKDVIERVLAVTPTRTTRQDNKYTFRGDAEEYATEESPEFTFTGKHLFEVMLDIASYKKMFPALYKNQIYFRPFWNGIMLTSRDLPRPVKAVLNSAIDQYCTSLDSYVENMVCVNDTNIGTVVEPYVGGYISARSENGSEISETTAVIPTQAGIYQSLKVELGEVNGATVGDIQSYIYEQENYDSLSDTSSAYPYSKSYALKFKRFERNYTELAHRIKKENEFSSALEYPALANITKAKCGEDVGLTLREYLKAFISDNSSAPFADLLFRPTYIPVVNARVRQYKPMMSAEDYEATLFYNQQSEVVDSEAFGEHVKGLVQKLGNHTEIRVYRFAQVDDVPAVGTIIDEKSVYDVAMAIYENHVDATICLVDYAELSTYIGVKNEIKTSDISATKWCNRFINWEEFLVFTHEPEIGDALSITKDALEGIISFTEGDALTCAMFTSYAKDGASIMTAFAPIKHLALGNSIYFQWEMLDNFAVGYKSEKAPDGATSLLTGSKFNRAQQAVRYCDIYGRAETIDFQLLKKGPNWENSSVDTSNLNITVATDGNKATFTSNIDFYVCVQVTWTILFKDKDGNEKTLTAVSDETILEPRKTLTIELKEETGTTVYCDKCYVTRVCVDEEKHKGAVMRMIAHSLPQKPSYLTFSAVAPVKLKKLLVKKDSAEGLKFATQYHFRQTWRDFVIGSGMSNFCSLVGGSCNQLQFFVSELPINRFERHINLDDANYFVLSDLPAFTIDETNLRVEITLPDGVNLSLSTRSWGLVGVDKYGNSQLIFGENKNVQYDPFEKTIYIVPRKKK